MIFFRRKPRIDVAKLLEEAERAALESLSESERRWAEEVKRRLEHDEWQKAFNERLRRGEVRILVVEEPDGSQRVEFRERVTWDKLKRWKDYYVVPAHDDPHFLVVKPESWDWVRDHLNTWVPVLGDVRAVERLEEPVYLDYYFSVPTNEKVIYPGYAVTSRGKALVEAVHIGLLYYARLNTLGERRLTAIEAAKEVLKELIRLGIEEGRIRPEDVTDEKIDFELYATLVALALMRDLGMVK